MAGYLFCVDMKKEFLIRNSKHQSALVVLSTLAWAACFTGKFTTSFYFFCFIASIQKLSLDSKNLHIRFPLFPWKIRWNFQNHLSSVTHILRIEQKESVRSQSMGKMASRGWHSASGRATRKYFSGQDWGQHGYGWWM